MNELIANAPMTHGATHNHIVDFYADHDRLAARVADYVFEGVQAGDRILVIATREHWNAIAADLITRGLDVTGLRDAHRVTTLDAHDTLAAFMTNGMPDADRFDATVGNAVAQCRQTLEPPARLRAWGEMVDVLWREGASAAAVRLEELWNQLMSRHEFTLLCTCGVEGFSDNPALVERVFASHSEVGLVAPASSVDSDATIDPHHAGNPAWQAIARRVEIEKSLRSTISELRTREESLRASEAQLRLVTDALPVLVSFVDTEQRYRFVSAAYERWFGHPCEELVGRQLIDVIGPAAYAAIEPHVLSALSGTSVSFESELPYRDGGSRFVDATYIPKKSAHGNVTGFVAFVADATERRALERLRAAEADRADRLLRVTAGIADAVSEADVHVALVDRVAEAIGASSTGLWLVDDAAGTVTLARSFGYSAVANRELSSVPLDATPGFPALDCIRENAAIWIDSKAELLSAYPHLNSLVTPDRRYKIACLPLTAQGRVLGSLGLTIESEGSLTSEERGFLMLIARYATQALERLRLFDAERRSRSVADAAANRMRIMSRLSRAFVETDLALSVRIRAVTNELSRTLGGCVTVSLLELDGKLHFAAVHHPNEEANRTLEELAASTPVAMGEGFIGTIASTGRSVHLSRQDPEEIAARVPRAYQDFFRRYPAYALIGAPLEVQGRVIGTVTAIRVAPDETYEAEDLALLEELADRAAVAIENSRLFEETVAARARADLLYAFAHAVSTAGRIEEVHQAALKAIETALGTSRLAILTSDDHGRPRFRAWRGLSDAYRQAMDGHSPWSRDATSFAPVLVEDVHSDPAMAPFRAVFAQEGIGALGFFPLVSFGKLLGTFMVYFGEPRRFQAHEVEVATSIANHLASVITRFGVMSRLEDTLKANEVFAGVLAHDLRNPLSAIMNSAQALLMHKEGLPTAGSDSFERKPLGRIVRSGQRMTVMIDQLLDFTRARSGGGIRITPHPASLAELCEQAVAELELAHPDWTIECEVKGNASGVWDGARLLQVISNIVGNAGEHGTTGRIAVSVDGTDSDRVRLEVRNEGAMPESIRRNAFEPFLGSSRVDHATARGLGLGLFIVREIVRAHDGEVKIESAGTDTTVVIQLPRKTGSDPNL